MSITVERLPQNNLTQMVAGKGIGNASGNTCYDVAGQNSKLHPDFFPSFSG